MNQFFSNIAEKKLAFLFKRKFSRNALQKKTNKQTNKQTLILVGYKHATIDRLVWINIRFLKMRVKICLYIRERIWAETKVKAGEGLNDTNVTRSCELNKS